MSLAKPWSSTAFRLALTYGVLLVLTMSIVLSVFYVQTVGVLRMRMDRQAENHMRRLVEHRDKYGEPALEAEIQQTLLDGVNTDTEILILMDGDGNPIIGNADVVPARRLTEMGVRDLKVRRNGRIIAGRVAVAQLSDGKLLAVGSDMQVQSDVEELFGRASLLAGLVALGMAVLGAGAFRRVVEERAADIRSTMARVATGDLRQRIPVTRRDDEFTLLNRDINTMLDRLELLMDGIRHVSNTIAHNLRTPLTRILLRLRNAQQATPEERTRRWRWWPRKWPSWAWSSTSCCRLPKWKAAPAARASRPWTCAPCWSTWWSSTNRWSRMQAACCGCRSRARPWRWATATCWPAPWPTSWTTPSSTDHCPTATTAPTCCCARAWPTNTAWTAAHGAWKSSCRTAAPAWTRRRARR